MYSTAAVCSIGRRKTPHFLVSILYLAVLHVTTSPVVFFPTHLLLCSFALFRQVEDNRFSVSVHYRNCARADVPRVKAVVERVQARHERIRMGSGKEVTGPLGERTGKMLIRPTSAGEMGSRAGRGRGRGGCCFSSSLVLSSLR